MVSIPACHAGNPGSIPGLGAFCFLIISDRRSSLVAEHSLSKRKVAGSNPACGFLFLQLIKKYSLLAGLNRRPFAYKANALPLS